MAPKKAQRGGSKAAGAAPGAQNPSEGLGEVAAAYLRFRKSPANLKLLKKAAAAHPSALAELCLAKAALLQGVEAALKADTVAEGERVLLAAAHEALEHVVTAAVDHRSLVALNHALTLLDRVLSGMPDWRVRHVQRERLLEGRSIEELTAQGAAAFDQLGQDVIEQDLWPCDVGYVRKDGRLQDADAFVRRVVGMYQQMAGHVAHIMRRAKHTDVCYDEAAADTRDHDIETASALADSDDDEPPCPEKKTASLPLRLVLVDYLPRREDRALTVWEQTRRAMEHVQWQAQRRRQRQEQESSEEGTALKARLHAFKKAELTARLRAFELGGFLTQQLDAECGGSGNAPEQRSSAASQEQRLAALLRLASLTLPDFRRLLEEEAAAGPAAGAAAAAAAAAGQGAGKAGPAAQEQPASSAEDDRLEQALQLLLSGSTGTAQFELPSALLHQAYRLAEAGRGLDGGGPALDSSPGGGPGSGWQQFRRLVEQLVADPEALAQCRLEMAEEIVELQLLAGQADLEPGQALALPSDYTLPTLLDQLPPSAEAIMPDASWREVYLRDADALKGPVWRQQVLQRQQELGRSRPATPQEQPNRGPICQLDTAAMADTASRYFHEMLCDILDFNTEGTSVSKVAAAHNAAQLLATYVGSDMWQCKMEMCLKRILLGHGLIEVVLEQQEQQEQQQGQQRKGVPKRRGPQFLGGLRGWTEDISSDDSEDEAEGSMLGPFASSESPRSAGRAGAAPRMAAAQLAALHAAAAGIHAASFAETLSHIVPEGRQRERGLQAAAHAMAAASEARSVALAQEAGHLLAQLLPIPDEGLPPNTAEPTFVSLSMSGVRQLRLLVLRGILAALRHLAKQGVLYRRPLLLQAASYVSVGLQEQSLQILGSQPWEPWSRLGVAPLKELLVMYGALAAYFSREFAAGPAALGPEFQDAMAGALVGVQLLPGQAAAADCSQGAAAGGVREAAAPVLGLSQVAVAYAAGAAADTLATSAEREARIAAHLVHESVSQAVGAPSHQPLAVLPPAAKCARGLALRCELVPALQHAVKQLHNTGHLEDPAVSMLHQLRRLQVWRNLLLAAYHSTNDLRHRLQKTAVLRFNQIMQLVSKPLDGDAQPGLYGLLCGAGGKGGMLEDAAQLCEGAVEDVLDECVHLRLLMFLQELFQWRSNVQQLVVLRKQVRTQARGLADGSPAKHSLSKLADGVSAVVTHVASDILHCCRAVLANLHTPEGRMIFVNDRMPAVPREGSQLVAFAQQLTEMAEAMRQTDGSNAAVCALVLSKRQELQNLLLEAETLLKGRLEALKHGRERMFYMADLVLRSEMSVFIIHFCMRSPLEPLAQLLVERALPRKWAQQMEAQQQAAKQEAAAGLLKLVAPASGQAAVAGKQEAAAAAANGGQHQQRGGGKGQQQPDGKQERQRLTPEEQQRQEAAAAAAAAALLEEEEQQAEKQAKERQRKQAAKKQAAQQRAAAAAAAAAAKRKAEEEEAAAAEAAAAAARQESEREAEQRRQACLEEERKRQEQLMQERLVEQTRREAELLNRQRQAAEQRRQQQEAEQRRQQQEAEQRRQEKAMQQPQQQDGTQVSAAAAPAVVTPAISEQLSARPEPPAGPAAASAAPAQMAQLAHGGPPPQALSPRVPQQPPQAPQPDHAQQAQAALPGSQQAAPPPSSGRQVGSIDWEAEAAAQERLLGADGELDISKLSLDTGDALPSRTAGAAARGAQGAAAASRPGSGSSAGRQAAPPPRPGSAGGQRPGSAGSDRPVSAGAAGRAERPPARFVSWTGAWVCECGQRNESIREHCRRCDARDPCLRWFQGNCEEHKRPCRLPHLWFDLPAEKPSRDQLERGMTLARPHPDFIYKRKPRAPAAKPAKPAAAAWQQPAAAAPVGSSWDAAAGQGQQQRQQQPSQPPQPERLQAAAGAASPSGNWAAVAKPLPAAAAQPPAAGQPAMPAPAHQAEPGGDEAEDELAGLLDMMGIGEANGTQSAAAEAASAAAGWGEPGNWAQHVGGSELESVEQAPGSWPAPGQAAEDAELEAAIQASLADAVAVASRHQAGAWQELPAAPRSGGNGAAAAQDSEALALAGLRNEAGEYNCFLNVVVQCLWRCAEFRQQVAGWDAGFRAHDPVLAALHALFAQLGQQEAARSSAAARGGGGGGSLPPVDPAPLREALAALPGQGFSLGEMNDAAELLLCVYEKVMEAEGASGRGGELAATFGLAVREEVHCAACGKTTHQNAYTQYFYNTQATTLQMARLVADGAASMGALLRDAEAQHRKSCDTDMSGCGTLNGVNHFLQAAPRVFTLQVAWETHAPDLDVVAGTLAALDATVDLGEVYQGVERGLHRYALRSMVCYYGAHYQALVLVPEAGGWLMFDDTRVTRVGTWADVRRKCEAGRIQPSVLFYEAA